MCTFLNLLSVLRWLDTVCRELNYYKDRGFRDQKLKVITSLWVTFKDKTTSQPNKWNWVLCLLGGFVAKSCPTLATPWTVACQAPPSMGFSRQEYWSGLLFPSPGESSWPRDWTLVSCTAGRLFCLILHRTGGPKWKKWPLSSSVIPAVFLSHGYKSILKSIVLIYYINKQFPVPDLPPLFGWQTYWNNKNALFQSSGRSYNTYLFVNRLIAFQVKEF